MQSAPSTKYQHFQRSNLHQSLATSRLTRPASAIQWPISVNIFSWTTLATALMSKSFILFSKEALLPMSRSCFLTDVTSKYPLNHMKSKISSPACCAASENTVGFFHARKFDLDWNPYTSIGHVEGSCRCATLGWLTKIMKDPSRL